MTQVRCRIVIAEGSYGRAATEASVRDVLQWVLSDSLCNLKFADPEEDDVAVEGEAVVLLKPRTQNWGHDEAVRDRIVTALLNRLRPEYESQVEIEVAYESDCSDSDDEDGARPMNAVRVWH